MTVGEGMKLLERNGFTRRNQVGSHINYVKDDKRCTVVYTGCNKTDKLHPKYEKQIRNLIK